MAAPIFKNWRTTYERVEKFISDTYFTDINLFGRLYDGFQNVDKIKHYFDSQSKMTVQDIDSLDEHAWQNVDVGYVVKPLWSLHWFRISMTIPNDWSVQNTRLIWQSGSEALVFSKNVTNTNHGRWEPLCGLNSCHKRDSVRLANCDINNGQVELLMQVTCSDLFGAGNGGMIQPPNPDHSVTLSTCKLAYLKPTVQVLMRDLEVLLGMAKELGPFNVTENQSRQEPVTDRGHQALYTANHIINVLIDHSPSQYEKAIRIARDFFSEHGGSKRHVLHAIGHCHIDTAWLWDYAETRRKTARSWSGVASLLETHSCSTFVCSQAQQLDWLREDQPALFCRLQRLAERGRFLPTGGTWVEMDANIPSGESFVRQFLYGQRFFEKYFNKRCKEFWLPDTFGYCAQTPQIMRHFGVSRFVTQKLSWNLVNTFPHNTFWWEGLDGSRVLAHFPSGDSYNMSAKVDEVCRTLRNFKDKGRSKHNLFLYGYGDGGQGPSEEMLERLDRMADVEGLPIVRHSTVDAFFQAVEAESASQSLSVWRGELYLELHNGTFTTHRQVKLGNVECERLLQNAECALVISRFARPDTPWTNDSAHEKHLSKIEELWKKVLLNQFHDVLPGTSIERVYQDVHSIYSTVEKEGRNLLRSFLQIILTDRPHFDLPYESRGRQVLFNPTCWPLQLYVKGKHGAGTLLAPPFGFSSVHAVAEDERRLEVVLTKKDNGVFHLANAHLSVTLDNLGRITSLYSEQKCTKREMVAENSFLAELCIYEDVPLYWDAWDIMDYHLESRRPIYSLPNFALESFQVDVECRTRVQLRWRFQLDAAHSSLEHCVILSAHLPYLQFCTTVQWNATHQCLRIEFPADIRCREQMTGSPYGYISRPVASNHSWQTAQYEVCAHGWRDRSEHGAGLAVLAHAIFGGLGGVAPLGLTLLRSSKSPDATADMGCHQLLYGLLPHDGCPLRAGVVQLSAQLTLQAAAWCHDETGCIDPLLSAVICDSRATTLLDRPLFQVDLAQVVIDTVKPACDQINAIVLRLYEAFGGACTVLLTIDPLFRFTQARLCNGLEEVLDEEEQLKARLCVLDVDPIKNELRIQLHMGAFQMLSLLLC